MIQQKILQVLSILCFVVTILSSDGFAKAPYAYKIRGNREEGRKGIGISAPDLEILSFLGYRERVKPDKGVDWVKLKFLWSEETK